MGSTIVESLPNHCTLNVITQLYQWFTQYVININNVSVIAKIDLFFNILFGLGAKNRYELYALYHIHQYRVQQQQQQQHGNN